MPIGTTAISGSIATDHLMHFPGRFADHLLAEHLDRLSLSFLIDDLVVHRGGVAANIAFGMGVLGRRPVLVGAVGTDFDGYRAWLERHGVNCGGVLTSSSAHTPLRLRITTLSGNGVRITGEDGADLHVGVVPAHSIRDPTGAGDAFRAGFLAGTDSGLSPERAAQLGALIATVVLESTGTQEWAINADRALERLRAAYGAGAAAEIEPVLRAALR